MHDHDGVCRLQQNHQKCVQSCLVVFVFLGFMGSNAAALDESIVVRKFSLVTEIGENVLHKDFNRRRLADGKFRRLSLTFRVAHLDVSMPCAKSWPVYLYVILMFS